MDFDKPSESDAIVIEDGEIEDEEDVHTRPIFEITFRGDIEYRKYSDNILKVLKEHLGFDGKHLSFLTTSGINGVSEKYVARIQAFENEEVKMEEEKVITIEDDDSCGQNSNDSQDFGEDLNKLFRIDPLPSTSLESARVPSYKRAIKEFLDDKIEEKRKKTDDVCPRPKPRSSCFNCGSVEHGLRDCQLPRNAKRINRAKMARNSKGERYHVDVDQRFAHLRPGVISEKLHKALRLRDGELPSFFYLMRVFGYPPGWLEDAKVSDSGLAMFNTENDVLKSEECSELQDDIKYDISKIIEYPGFNISPGSNFYDDYKHHNVPPLNPSQTREQMIIALGESAVKGFKRMKLNTNATENTQASIEENAIAPEPHDMEIEDADVTLSEEVDIRYTRPIPPPLPLVSDENVLPPLPSASRSPSPSVLQLNKERSQSPTLAELQEKQRALLLKLEGGDDVQSDEENQLDFSKCTDETSAISAVTPSETSSTPVPMDNEVQKIIKSPNTSSSPSTPVQGNYESKKIIKSSYMGTPVLQFSPFEKLPSGDNFKVGVSDVISFENLPDSTGKYESMKDVLKKVRNIKKQLNSEDD